MSTALTFALPAAPDRRRAFASPRAHTSGPPGGNAHNGQRAMQKRGQYSIRFRLEHPLHTRNMGEEYIQEIQGDIVFRRNATDPEEAVGILTAFAVDGERAVIAGEDLLEVVDSYNWTLTTCFEWLFNINKGRWRKPIRQRWGKELSANWLYVDSVAIEPAHRGRDIGLLAVCRLLDRFAPSDGLAILEPGPMQFGPHGADRAWCERFKPEMLPGDEAKARKALPRIGTPSASPRSATLLTGPSGAASTSISRRSASRSRTPKCSPWPVIDNAQLTGADSPHRTLTGGCRAPESGT
jgi:hypothetical protein